MTQAEVAESCFDKLDAVQYMSKAVECRRRVLSLIPDAHVGRLHHFATFSRLLLRRFLRFSDPADINEAIQCLTQVMQLTPEGHPDKPSWLNDLGNSYRARFLRLGEPADVDMAIKFCTQAVKLTPNDHPNKPSRLYDLGSSYTRRFERLGDVTDVDKAIECDTQSVQLTPDDHPGKPSQLNDLGSSYLSRFERLGELADVEKAIKHYTQAVRLTPDGHPDKSGWLNNLGNSYMHQFERLGELADMDKAIECYIQVLKLTPDGHPDISSRLNNLGNSYLSRFERLGELADMDKAVECHTQSVQLAPDGHPGKSSWHNNLGNSYLSRFERLGELADVDKAIMCYTQAVQLNSDGHLDKPRWLNNLGNSYMRRCERLGELADVEKAIECHTQAVQLTPNDHPDKRSWLSNLGNSYRSRFKRLGKLADMDKAIECDTQSVQLTPDGHPGKPNRISNLGSSYMHRFKCLAELADVDKAIEYQTQAVQLTPDGHPDKPTQLGNLGGSYIARFNCLSTLADLTNAQAIFQQGAQLGLISSEPQLKCARYWAKTSSLLGLSPQGAYERCFKLLPHLIWLGTTINHRYSLLTKVNDLASESAAWAISVQSYELAIEWLEEGRSIVWNQLLRLRTPFDHLSTIDFQLAQQLKDIASQLENAGSRAVAQSFLIDMEFDLETAAQHHRRLAAQWDCCLEQARSIPGLHNFMQPRSAAELKAAAVDGPVVIINTYSTRWDALIIFPQCDETVHVPLLDKLLLDEAGRSRAQPYSGCMAGHRSERGRGFGRVQQRPASEDPIKSSLVALWLEVVKPILDALGYVHQKSVAELPHVTWCATGSLASIPLHAAGPYDGLSPNAFDLVTSSYTPSLGALLASSFTPSPPEVGLLAVGQEYTRGLCPLPNTVKELETIKAYAQTTCFLQLSSKNASVNAVLNAMDQHSWVHLACHATQNPVNPLHSAFHLSDGDLTLESITKRQFRNKGLAFLSACQTARGDGALPDEAVHLAAGMLMAGYPSVIATLWSIWDADGPEVAGRVYAELLKDGNMDHRRAAKALHKAVLGLREKVGEDKFERWVPFIHIGA